MKKLYFIAIALFMSNLLSNCKHNDDIPAETEIQNFVWKGLNAYYLWYDEIPDLQDSRFSSQKEITDFVAAKNPNDLFESLLFERNVTDKWSWMVSDYIALEQLFAGVTRNNGMEFGLKAISATSNQVFGYVRYIIPNSDASTKNIHRGDIIYAINNTPLTRDNYKSLLFSDIIYTVNFGTYSNTGGTIQVVSNGVDVSLTKEFLVENPIHTTTINEIDGHKIGYLFYNQFVSNYDTQLNDAFLQFKNENISDLVLDLRYNGGGSVQTAINLSSMITGQFTGELLVKEKWNSKWQNYFETENEAAIINNFVNTLKTGEGINSLGLNKLIVLVSGSSASASELVINGLNPYIDVVLIGTKTTGKYVGSVTLYDSDNFRKSSNSLNQNHTYAMQPLVLEIVNKLGENDKDGFEPDHFLPEDYSNLGTLGDVNEPLFAKAIHEITGLRLKSDTNRLELPTVSNSKAAIPFYNNMYVELK